MSKINVYFGLTVEKLEFEQSNGPVGLHDKVVTYPVNATVRNYTQDCLHPQKLAEKFVKDLVFCKDNFDLNIASHSNVIINVLGTLIDKNKINSSDVTIFVLNDDNSEVTNTSTFDEEGYLVDWPYGFLDYNYDEINFTINKI